MKNRKKYIKRSALVLLVLIGLVWLNGPQSVTLNSMTPWKAGYASPKQYYEENGENLKSTIKIIDNISYTFDDLGNAMQDENDGKWNISLQYHLTSGAALKNTWYKVDDEWYYFDSKGAAIKNKFIKIDGKKYFLKKDGKLARAPFSLRLHRFGATYGGEIIVNGSFLDSNGKLYLTNGKGHGRQKSTATMELLPQPQIRWGEITYYQDSPAYFFGKEYSLAGETKSAAESFPLQDGQSLSIPLGAKIYTKNDETGIIYIYDKIDNSFYSYTPGEKRK